MLKISSSFSIYSFEQKCNCIVVIPSKQKDCTSRKISYVKIQSIKFLRSASQWTECAELVFPFVVFLTGTTASKDMYLSLTICFLTSSHWTNASMCLSARDTGCDKSHFIMRGKLNKSWYKSDELWSRVSCQGIRWNRGVKATHDRLSSFLESTPQIWKTIQLNALSLYFYAFQWSLLGHSQSLRPWLSVAPMGRTYPRQSRLSSPPVCTWYPKYWSVSEILCIPH